MKPTNLTRYMRIASSRSRSELAFIFKLIVEWQDDEGYFNKPVSLNALFNKLGYSYSQGYSLVKSLEESGYISTEQLAIGKVISIPITKEIIKSSEW